MHAAAECFTPDIAGGTGPAEALPGGKSVTDRVRERISEGFPLVEPGWIVLRGAKAVSLWLLDICEFESTGNLELGACG